MTTIDLSGKWELSTSIADSKIVELPGSLDEFKVGNPDKVAKPWHPDVEDRNKKLNKTMEESKAITSRLTRNYTFEGPAHFVRCFEEEIPSGKRVFLVAERARALSLLVDGERIEQISGSLSTPYRFEVTGKLHKGSKIELISDNTYPGLPYRDIVFSSAATDESQTNWNGIIGKLYLEITEKSLISNVLVYPIGEELELCVELSLDAGLQGPSLMIKGDCLEKEMLFKGIGAGRNNTGEFFLVRLPKIPIKQSSLQEKWDEYAGNLKKIEVLLVSGADDNLQGSSIVKTNGIETDDDRQSIISCYIATFGIRSFSYDDKGRLTLNGRRFFLRSEANCAFFPETGHPPMDEEGWEKIVDTYMEYGVNCLRFHSWCPPEAAFCVADKRGLLIQPELSHWNPRDAFGSEESRCYYENELREILRNYGNHPSFVMLTWGNELHADEKGVDEMHRLLDIAHELDSTRLFAWGSNNFYGSKGIDLNSDFYTSTNYKEEILRESGNTGIYNTRYAAADYNYDDAIAKIRKEYHKPVFSFEVGQYEILPDFDEIDEFKGVTRADNLQIVRDRVKELGISENEWKKRVNATGEMSLLAYREEVEAVMRTESMSGISLLGLQDFSGQGTALVGMLNTHLERKPFNFSEPSRFKAFYSEKAILALLPRYTYTNNECIEADIKVANYGKQDIAGVIEYSLVAMDGTVFAKGNTSSECRSGELTLAGRLQIDLSGIKKNTRFNLVLSSLDEELSNIYPVWVYAETAMKKEAGDSCPAPHCPEGIYETEVFDEKAKEILSKGGKVYLSPRSTKEALPHSIKAQFSTDFWSVGTFPNQEGAMGQLIDSGHPIFEDFPTEDYTNFQWWPMATQRALILPEYMDTIITEMDCYAYLRPMTQLMEVNCGGGKLMISSMGLQDLQQFPEARALLRSIYSYMDSEKFEPRQSLSSETVEALFK